MNSCLNTCGQPGRVENQTGRMCLRDPLEVTLVEEYTEGWKDWCLRTLVTKACLAERREKRADCCRVYTYIQCDGRFICEKLLRVSSALES